VTSLPEPVKHIIIGFPLVQYDWANSMQIAQYFSMVWAQYIRRDKPRTSGQSDLCPQSSVKRSTDRRAAHRPHTQPTWTGQGSSVHDFLVKRVSVCTWLKSELFSFGITILCQTRLFWLLRHLNLHIAKVKLFFLQTTKQFVSNLMFRNHISVPIPCKCHFLNLVLLPCIYKATQFWLVIATNWQVVRPIDVTMNLT
jgi:hypothetical protein